MPNTTNPDTQTDAYWLVLAPNDMILKEIITKYYPKTIKRPHMRSVKSQTYTRIISSTPCSIDWNYFSDGQKIPRQQTMGDTGSTPLAFSTRERSRAMIVSDENSLNVSRDENLLLKLESHTKLQSKVTNASRPRSTLISKSTLNSFRRYQAVSINSEEEVCNLEEKKTRPNKLPGRHPLGEIS